MLLVASEVRRICEQLVVQSVLPIVAGVMSPSKRGPPNQNRLGSGAEARLALYIGSVTEVNSALASCSP